MVQKFGSKIRSKILIQNITFKVIIFTTKSGNITEILFVLRARVPINFAPNSIQNPSFSQRNYIFSPKNIKLWNVIENNIISNWINRLWFFIGLIDSKILVPFDNFFPRFKFFKIFEFSVLEKIFKKKTEPSRKSEIVSFHGLTTA